MFVRKIHGLQVVEVRQRKGSEMLSEAAKLAKMNRKRFEAAKRRVGKWFPRGRDWDLLFTCFAALDGSWPFVGAIYLEVDFWDYNPFVVVRYDSERRMFKQIFKMRFKSGEAAKAFVRKKFKSCAFWRFDTRKDMWVIDGRKIKGGGIPSN